jgi:hypothetical protein
LSWHRAGISASGQLPEKRRRLEDWAAARRRSTANPGGASGARLSMFAAAHRRSTIDPGGAPASTWHVAR